MHKKLLCILSCFTVNITLHSQNLIDAVTTGNKTQVERILQQEINNPAFDINQKDTIGSPALSYAAAQGFTEIAQLLLAYQANPNIRCALGTTPLWWATNNQKKETMQLLLEHGADPNIADTSFGKTPLWWAVFHGNKELVQLLLDYKAQPFTRHGKAGSAYDVVVKNLKNSDLDDVDQKNLEEIKSLLESYPLINLMRKTTQPGSRGKPLENIGFRFT